MQEHADLAAVAPDRRARTPVVGQRLDEMAEPVRVDAGLGQPEEHLGAGIVERDGEHGADLLGLGAAGADVLEEVAHEPDALEAGAREAPVDQPLEPVAQRPERERRGQRADRDGERRVAGQEPDEQRAGRVRARQQRGQQPVDEGAVEQAVDRVEAVPGDGDRDGDGQPGVQQAEHRDVGVADRREDHAPTATSRRATAARAARRRRATGPAAGARGRRPCSGPAARARRRTARSARRPSRPRRQRPAGSFSMPPSGFGTSPYGPSSVSWPSSRSIAPPHEASARPAIGFQRGDGSRPSGYT